MEAPGVRDECGAGPGRSEIVHRIDGGPPGFDELGLGGVDRGCLLGSERDMCAKVGSAVSDSISSIFTPVSSPSMAIR